MAKPLTEEEKANWKNIINDQSRSNLSVASWCQQCGILTRQFYYWKKKLISKPPIDRSSFSEITETKIDSSEIIIEYQGFNVRINQHFEPSLLQSCLEVLKNVNSSK